MSDRTLEFLDPDAEAAKQRVLLTEAGKRIEAQLVAVEEALETGLPKRLVTLNESLDEVKEQLAALPASSEEQLAQARAELQAAAQAG